MRRFAAVTVALGGLCLLGASPAQATDPCTAAGGVPGTDGPALTCTFATPNSAGNPSFTFVVPSNAVSVTLSARGAQGGTVAPATGGLGAEADGTFAGLAGQSLTVVVAASSGFPDGAPAQTASGGGGGGSRVSLADSPLVVAGGGGGSAKGVTNGGLGGNGGNAGATGTSGGGITSGSHNEFSVVGGAPGAAASQAAGGAGGNGGHTVGTCLTGSSGGSAGSTGSATSGGAGGIGGALNSGGGGGGGLFGGGGAGSGARCVTQLFGTLTSAGGGGGGGSSFVDPSATAPAILQGAGAPQTGDGVVVISWTVAVLGPNLVRNGGFEKPVVPGGNGYIEVFAGGKLGPWTVTAGSVDVDASDWVPAAGAQSLDLAGDQPGAIIQQLNLPATGTYQIRFKLAGNMDCAPARKTVGVLWNGSAVVSKTFNTTPHTPADPGWKSISVTVPGFAGPASLAFTNLSAGSCGAALDAVTVRQVS